MQVNHIVTDKLINKLATKTQSHEVALCLGDLVAFNF
jgi:hypothetical protein